MANTIHVADTLQDVRPNRLDYHQCISNVKFSLLESRLLLRIMAEAQTSAHHQSHCMAHFLRNVILVRTPCLSIGVTRFVAGQMCWRVFAQGTRWANNACNRGLFKACLGRQVFLRPAHSGSHNYRRKVLTPEQTVQCWKYSESGTDIALGSASSALGVTSCLRMGHS